MKVWRVSWEVWCGGDDSMTEQALFTTKEAAEASMGAECELSEIEIRDEPLAMQKRYSIYVPWKNSKPTIQPTETYVVNELQEGYAEGIQSNHGWWLDGLLYNGPDEAELAEYVGREVSKKRR